MFLKKKIEKEFNIEIESTTTENWDDIDVPIKIKEQRTDLKESDIKSIICGKLSQTITKNDLESLDAWDEVKSWFDEISKLVNKVV